MTTVAEVTDRRPTRSHPGRSLGWAFSMTFADRAVWRRIVAMAVGIGICSLALLGLASISPSLHRMEATAGSLQPSHSASGSPSFSYHYVSFSSGGETVTGALLSGPSQASPPPGAPTFPQPGEIYASPRLAALLASSAGAEVQTLLPGRVIGVLPTDALRGSNDLFFYRGSTATAMMSSGTGWGHAASSEGLDPELWILLATGSIVLLIPLILFVALCSRLGSARRERRNGVLALLGAGRSRIRLLGAVESGSAGLLGSALGISALLVLRQFVGSAQFSGVGLRPEDVGPTAAGGWWVSIGIVVVAAVTGSLVGYRPADAARPHGSIPMRRKPFHWWWRVLLLLLTTAAVWWIAQQSRSPEWFGRSQTEGVLLPSIATLLVMLTLVALSAPLVHLVCRLWRPASSAGQLARGRILADGTLTTRSAAALGTVLAGAITLLPLLDSVSAAEGGSTNTYGSLQGSVSDIIAVQSAAERSGGLQFIGISSIFGTAVQDSSAGPQLAVVTCAMVDRLDPTATCRDGDIFRYRRADQSGYPLPAPPYRIGIVLRDSDSAPEGRAVVTWSPPAATRSLAATQDASSVDILVNNVAGADFLLTPAAASREFPDLAGTELNLTVIMQLRPGSVPDVQLALAPLGDRAFDLLSLNSESHSANLFRPWIVTALISVSALVLLICALAQTLTTVEQIRERKRPYALGRAAGVPLSLLSRSIGLSLVVPILVTMVAAVGAGLLLNVVLGQLLELPAAAIAWPVVGIGVGAALLTAALVALGASWSLQRSTRPEAMRTE